MNVYFSNTMKINEYSGFYLIPDHIGSSYSKPWDDFGYIVTFKVYAVVDGVRHSLGITKILVKGFENTAEYFEKNGAETDRDKIYKVDGLLVPDFCVSMASSIDFYTKLNVVLKKDEEKISKYLQNVCDASYYNDNKEIFLEWPGFNTSIFRDGSVPQSILRNGYQVAIGRYQPEKSFEIEVNVPMDSFESLSFKFNRKRDVGITNINLLIGTNGVGKTHVLKYMSDVVTGLVGSAEEWPCFNKLIVMAYSPFENFYTKSELLINIEKKYPSKNKSNSKARNKVKLLKVNEYEYLGFRNDEGIFDVDWPRERSAKAILSILEYDYENSWVYSTSRLKMIFDTLSLSIDFDEISMDLIDGTTLNLGKEDLIDEPSLYRKKIKFEAGIKYLKDGEELSLSSGQMIYSYMLPALVSEIVDESLIIIDEPELYLHPGIEVGLIKMLKYLLKDTKSSAVIATHSAVLAREVEKKAVTILRKENGVTRSYTPSFETYGASIDLINTEAFDDFSVSKPFQADINALLIENDNDVSAVIEKYSNEFGDDALIYLASKKIDEDDDLEMVDR